MKLSIRDKIFITQFFVGFFALAFSIRLIWIAGVEFEQIVKERLLLKTRETSRLVHEYYKKHETALSNALDVSLQGYPGGAGKAYPPGLENSTMLSRDEVALLKNTLAEVMSQQTDFTEMVVLGKDKERLLELSNPNRNIPSFTEANFTGQKEFISAFERKGIHVSPVRFTPKGLPFMDMYVPISPEGMLCARINLMGLGTALKGSEPGGTGDIFILDPSGKIIFHPLPAMIGEKSVLLNLDLSQLNVSYVDKKALEYKDRLGRPGLAAGVAVPELSWYAVISLPLSQARKSLYIIERDALIWLLVTLTLVVILASRLSYFLSVPIRTLRVLADEFAKGNLSASSKITTGDELESLGTSLNQMAQKLKTFYEDLEGLVRERSQALLTESVTLSAIVSSMADAVVVTDPQGKVSYLNSQAKRLLRIGDEVLGKPLSQIFSSAQKVVLSKFTLDTFFASAGPDASLSVREEEIILLWEKEEMVLKVYASPLFTPQEKIVEGIGSVREGLLKGLTGERRFIGEVFVFNDLTQIRSFEKAKSDFIITLSHELRTPLTSLLEGLSLFQDGYLGALNKEQKDCLVTMVQDTSRIRDLLSQTIDLSRMEAGLSELHCEELDIVPFLERAANYFKEKMVQKSVVLEKELPLQIPRVFADGEKLLQVFSNLIGNAVKFSPPGAKVIVSAREEGDYLRIAVRDFGPGISLEQKRHIFEKFYSLRSPFEHSSGGVGVGLYISKSIIESLGGLMSLDSEAGKGSTFSFTLCLCKPPLKLGILLQEKLAKAKKRRSPFSAILLTVENFTRNIQGLSNEEADAFLKMWEASFSSVLRADVDRVVMLKDKKVFLILVEEFRADATRTAQRIVSVLSEVRYRGQTAAWEMVYRVYTFPEDFADRETFLVMLKEYL